MSHFNKKIIHPTKRENKEKSRTNLSQKQENWRRRWWCWNQDVYQCGDVNFDRYHITYVITRYKTSWTQNSEELVRGKWSADVWSQIRQQPISSTTAGWDTMWRRQTLQETFRSDPSSSMEELEMTFWSKNLFQLLTINLLLPLSIDLPLYLVLSCKKKKN